MDVAIRFIEVNGCRYAVRIGGRGRPLLALHNLMSSGDLWMKWIRKAGLSDVRVIAPDARAHGESSATTEPADYAPSSHVRDVIAILDRLGLARLRLTGYSMGARVAALIAARHPDRVQALGIYAPPPHTMQYGGPHLFTRAAETIKRAGLEAAIAAMERDQPGWGRQLRAMRPHGVAAALEGFHNDEFAPTAAELGLIRCPTIVLGIENDPHPVETARFYSDQISNAEFRLTRARDRDRDLGQMLRDLMALQS